MIKAIKNTILAGLLFIGGVVTGLAINAQSIPQVPTYEAPQFVTVDKVLYETTEDFYISEGEIGVTFTDGSWISANPESNQYTFQPIDLGDWSLDFDNLQDLKNCVNTYLELVNQ